MHIQKIKQLKQQVVLEYKTIYYSGSCSQLFGKRQ